MKGKKEGRKEDMKKGRMNERRDKKSILFLALTVNLIPLEMLKLETRESCLKQ